MVVGCGLVVVDCWLFVVWLVVVVVVVVVAGLLFLLFLLCDLKKIETEKNRLKREKSASQKK